jgi:hypothetical protein
MWLFATESTTVYLVHTTQESSAPLEYGGHGIPAQLVSRKYMNELPPRAPLPGTDSELLSTQIGTRPLA